MTARATVDRAALEAMLCSCPFHRLLGLTLEDMSAEEGMVSISLEARQELSRSDERIELHGGVLATLIDLAGDYAAALKVGGGVPTIHLSVDYLRMARGARAVATARALKIGRTIGTVDVEVRDETGTLVAVGRGTYATGVPG